MNLLRSLTAPLAMLLTLGCVGCGADADESCFELELTYGGSAQGVVYIRGTSPGGSMFASYVSVERALAELGPSALRASVSCSSPAPATPAEWTFTVWIDRDGDERVACDQQPRSDECVADATDPQGTFTALIGRGDHLVPLTIVDP